MEDALNSRMKPRFWLVASQPHVKIFDVIKAFIRNVFAGIDGIIEIVGNKVAPQDSGDVNKHGDLVVSDLVIHISSFRVGSNGNTISRSGGAAKPSGEVAL